MTKKANLIYKIITAITLILPTSLYLFLSATIFNIIPDYIVYDTPIEDMVIVNDFIYTTDTTVSYDGVVVYNADLDTYGINVTSDDIIKIGHNYYSLQDNALTDIKKFEVQKQVSYKIPITVFISALGVGIVLMVVNRKMEWYKKYPRTSVLISLLVGTIVLYIMNMVVANILNVFLVATVSWAIYCIEYNVKQGKLNSATAEKESNDLIDTLRKALK